MNNEAVLNLLSNLSTVFTVLSVTFAIAAIVLFFALDVKSAVLQLSGRTRAEETKRMNENYALTGVLREGISAQMMETAEPSGAPGPPEQESSETAGLFLTGNLPVSSVREESESEHTLQNKEKARTERSGAYLFRINKEVISVGTEERIG